MTPVRTEPTIGSVPLDRLTSNLRGVGLRIDVGAAVLRVHASAPLLAKQLQQVYPYFPLDESPQWADVHCRLDPADGVRRWLRPQVEFRSDGRVIFDPFPARSPLPLFEWGCNWLIGQRCNHLLLLHAGAVECDGLALVLPATPGSGKSTLTAALTQRGWRLLSDEFGALDPTSGLMHAMLKPVALKNASIDVIGRFSASARIGPSFAGTRKGTVAHLAADADAVARRHQAVRPGAIVLPRWEAGSATHFTPLPPQQAFAALAFNAFNYQLIGETAYDAVLTVARRCPAWQLTYSDLDDAIATLAEAWPSVRQRALEP